MLRALIARLAMLAFGVAPWTGCTLLLDFDEPIAPAESDASVPDGGPDALDLPDADLGPDAAAAANCANLEPNDTLVEPILITPMVIEAAICPDLDKDFYTFVLLANTNLTITLDFDNADSDLNLRLYNSAGAVVAAAVGTDSTEVIARGPGLANALPGGDYRIEVVSATEDVTLDYSLTLELVPGI